MKYSFITNDDIISAIREDQLNSIIDNDQRILKSAEKTAVIQIKSKLGSRYDMAQVFLEIPSWKNTTAYLANDRVYFNGNFYQALLDNNGMSPEVNTNDEWVEDDPRDQLLVTYCVDITLFHIHSRVNRRKIPDIRIERYNQALEWLEMIKSGEEAAELPILVGGTNDIPYGSNEQIDHYY